MKRFVGVDWGSETHAACVVDETGAVLDVFEVGHDPGGIGELVRRGVGEGELTDVTFVLERRDGLLVDALLRQGAVTWHINPKQVDRFRDRFSPAGSKSDALDARVLADSARTDPRAFQRVEARPAELVELRGIGRLHTALGESRDRLVNQANEALGRYHPAFVALQVDLCTDWGRALFKLAPNPDKARKVRRPAIDQLLRAHRVRKVTAEQVVACLRSAALVAAEGVQLVEQLSVEACVAQLDAVVEHLRVVERRMEKLLGEVCAAPPGSATAAWAPAATALLSMPGVGSKIAATVLAEAPEALRSADYPALRGVAGTAPVTKASGKRSKTPAVSMRHGCNVHLRNAMHHWGRTAAQADPHWADYRRGCLARGHTAGRANRQVADRLLRVLTALVSHGTTYDVARWPAPTRETALAG